MSAEANTRDVHGGFVRCVMSDVYALLDYLSGRAVPAIAPPVPYKRTQTRFGEPSVQAPGPDATGNCGRAARDAEAIDDDLMDRNGLVCRIMRISAGMQASPASPTDVAFLILARDLLNRQAAPVTGSTISFTLRVMHELLGRGRRGRGAPMPSDYLIDDESLDSAASALARFVRLHVGMLWVLLVLAVMLSTYVAFGKLVLDTRDAVNRDLGNNISTIMSEANPRTAAPRALTESETTYEWIELLCGLDHPTASLNLSCGQHHELRVRKENVHDLLARWVPLKSFKGLPDEESSQWATTMIGVGGNYLLPVLYGWLGALGSVLRRLNRQLADYLLTPRDLRASRIRIVLGVVTGACIGLFVNNSTGAATLSGLGGAAVTLSASGVAFLAGYGVEAVFKMLDGLIDHIFRLRDADRGSSAA
jgi:hypothetical protein